MNVSGCNKAKQTRNEIESYVQRSVASRYVYEDTINAFAKKQLLFCSLLKPMKMEKADNYYFFSFTETLGSVKSSLDIFYSV
jgi:hypothetical protein